MKHATLIIIRSGPYAWLGEKKKGAQIGSGKLNAPGGRLEEGESAIECAVRETQEEFNITVHPEHLRPIGILECYSQDELFQIVHVFHTERYVGQPLETDSMVPELVPVDRLPFERMHEGDRHWFARAAEGNDLGRVRLWYERPGEGFIRHEFVED